MQIHSTCMPLWCWIIIKSSIVAWFTRSLKSNYFFFSSFAPHPWRLPFILLLANLTDWSIHWHILISISHTFFLLSIPLFLCAVSYVTMANDCSQPRNSILPLEYFFYAGTLIFSMEIADIVKKRILFQHFMHIKMFLMVKFLKGLVK